MAKQIPGLFKQVKTTTQAHQTEADNIIPRTLE
jgi:hypothetical protein